MTRAELPPISSVYPSGAALATRSVAMLLPAPVTFSTTTDLPHASLNLSANNRAVTSGATPGGKPTMIRTPCSGYPACANACPAAASTATMTKARTIDAMAACLPCCGRGIQTGAYLPRNAVGVMSRSAGVPRDFLAQKEERAGRPRSQEGS